jgi:hypothetical protein
MLLFNILLIDNDGNGLLHPLWTEVFPEWEANFIAEVVGAQLTFCKKHRVKSLASRYAHLRNELVTSQARTWPVPNRTAR